MRIMHDLDGVFFNFSESFKKHLDHVGLGYLWKSSADLTPSWSWYKTWGWDDQRFVDVCNEAADCGCLFTGPMREGAKEAWDRIVRTGHEIVIATDRSFGSTPASSERNTYEWLEEHDLYYDELWFTVDKTVCKPDVAVDDKPQNFLALMAAGVDAYLIDRPWNQDLGDIGHRRLSSVLDFAAIVESL